VPVTFTATITSIASSPATGSMSFFDNGVSIGTATLAGNPATAAITISTFSAGAHRITATYAGDSKNQASNSSAAPFNQVVQQAQTVTAISAAPSSGIAGTSETFMAAVALARGSAPLTGAVIFTSGTQLLGAAQLNPAGVAAISPTLAVGDYGIVATYQGDANALGSASDVPACSVTSPTFCSGSGPLLYTLAATATQTALVISPTTAVAASPIVFTAMVVSNGSAPTGSVNILANGAVIGTSPLSGGTATFTDASLAVGSYAITAEYLGDANDAISTSTSVAETVNAIPTTVSLTSVTTTGNDPQVTLTATVGGSGNKLAPSGTIMFMSGETLLGKAALDANGVATLAPILAKGANYSIDAVYGGDSYHGSSRSQTISVAGVAYGFTVSIAPPSVAISSTQSATVTVTLTSVANFADTITLDCASLPASVSCRFASASLNLPAGGTAATQLTIGAGSTQTATFNHRAGRASFSLAALLLPFSLAFGCYFRSQRRANARVFAALPNLVLAAAALAATGCGAALESAASQGNYVIQVTATGATSNVVRSQNVGLNVAR
ncbi:MAG: Ig-like domain-containing protein, partial [Terracidiphilus sp.]